MDRFVAARRWTLVELGETPADALVRETREEAGSRSSRYPFWASSAAPDSGGPT